MEPNWGRTYHGSDMFRSLAGCNALKNKKALELLESFFLLHPKRVRRERRDSLTHVYNLGRDIIAETHCFPIFIIG